MEIVSLSKPFKVLTNNKATTTFLKQVLDNGLHMWKLHTWKTFLSQFNAIYEHVAGNNNFLTDYLTREAEYLTMTTLNKIKELEDNMIDFNEFLENLSTWLEHSDVGVKAIVDNLRVEVEEFSKGAKKIIRDMKDWNKKE